MVKQHPSSTLKNILVNFISGQANEMLILSRYKEAPQTDNVVQLKSKENNKMAKSTIERLHALLVTGNIINEQEVVKETQHLEDDLGMDSLDAVEFIMAIEEEFDIELPDDESEALTTIASVVELVNKKIEE